MRRAIPALVLLILLLVLAGRPMVMAEDFRPLPFHDLAERVNDRYRGRLLAAGMTRPTPHERALGAALVYEFRLLTPQGNLLKIRMDARSGRFLEIAGRGQLDALRGDDDDDEDED